MTDDNTSDDLAEESKKSEFSRRKALKGVGAGTLGGTLFSFSQEGDEETNNSQAINENTVIRVSGTKQNPVSLPEFSRAVDTAIARAESEEGAWVLQPVSPQSNSTQAISELTDGTKAEGVSNKVTNITPTTKLVEACYAVTQSDEAFQYLGFISNNTSAQAVRDSAAEFVEDPTVIKSNNTNIGEEKSNSGEDANDNKSSERDKISSEVQRATNKDQSGVLKQQQSEDSSWSPKVSGRIELETCPEGVSYFDVKGQYNPFTPDDAGWSIDVNSKAWPGASGIDWACGNPGPKECRNWWLDAEAIEITYEDSTTSSTRGNKYDPDPPVDGNTYDVTIGYPIAAYNWQYQTYDASLVADIEDLRAYWSTEWEESFLDATDERRSWIPGGTAISDDPPDCSTIDGDGDIKIGDVAGVVRYTNGADGYQCPGEPQKKTYNTPYVEIWWRNRCC